MSRCCTGLCSLLLIFVALNINHYTGDYQTQRASSTCYSSTFDLAAQDWLQFSGTCSTSSSTPPTCSAPQCRSLVPSVESCTPRSTTNYAETTESPALALQAVQTSRERLQRRMPIMLATLEQMCGLHVHPANATCPSTGHPCCAAGCHSGCLDMGILATRGHSTCHFESQKEEYFTETTWTTTAGQEGRQEARTRSFALSANRCFFGLYRIAFLASLCDCASILWDPLGWRETALWRADGQCGIGSCYQPTFGPSWNAWRDPHDPVWRMLSCKPLPILAKRRLQLLRFKKPEQLTRSDG